MKKLKLHIKIIFVALLIVSCNSDDQTSCVKRLTMDINSEIGIDLKEIYFDSEFTVSISRFTSPNGDGSNDVFGILIVNLNNNEIFQSFSNSNPLEFIKNGELKISNECEELFSTNDTSKLIWNPGFEPPQPEGTYNVELKLTFINETSVNIKETFEVVLFTN